jgi:uncharacterized membrane protein
MKNKLLSVLCAVSVFLFLLTVSIGLPIYIRPFYYAHIGACDLEAVSGYSESEIRQAYDEVLDYLTLPGREFGTGVMPISHEAEHHFADCKVLFDLNAVVLVGSVVVLPEGMVCSMRSRTDACTSLTWEAASFGMPMVINHSPSPSSCPAGSYTSTSRLIVGPSSAYCTSAI